MKFGQSWTPNNIGIFSKDCYNLSAVRISLHYPYCIFSFKKPRIIFIIIAQINNIYIIINTNNKTASYMGFRFVTQFQHQTDSPMPKLLLQPQSHNPVFLRRLRLLISIYCFSRKLKCISTQMFQRATPAVFFVPAVSRRTPLEAKCETN